MEEIWIPVENYEIEYELSNLGRLRSKDRKVKNGNGYRTAKGKIIKPIKCKNGYYEYALIKNGKREVFLAHRLVAKYFIPNPENKPEVNHLDEDITNNVTSNLEWCTSKENANYGHRNEKCRKYTEKQMKAIYQYAKDGSLIAEYQSIGEAGRIIGGDISAIIRALKGKQKTSYGYIWKYKE